MMRHHFSAKSHPVLKLEGDIKLEGDVSYKGVEHSDEIAAVYNIFEDTIRDSVTCLTGGEWPAQMREDFLHDALHDQDFRVLFHNGKPIGCFEITHRTMPCIVESEIANTTPQEQESLNQRETYQALILRRMYLRQDYHGKGIGKALIKMALEQAHAEQIPLELSVMVSNKKALGAYIKQGFCAYTTMIQGWNQKYLMRHQATPMQPPASSVREYHHRLEI